MLSLTMRYQEARTLSLIHRGASLHSSRGTTLVNVEFLEVLFERTEVHSDLGG
jgi:hypothetical protein